jgi:hypothetical protein
MLQLYHRVCFLVCCNIKVQKSKGEWPGTGYPDLDVEVRESLDCILFFVDHFSRFYKDMSTFSKAPSLAINAYIKAFPQIENGRNWTQGFRFRPLFIIRDIGRARPSGLYNVDKADAVQLPVLSDLNLINRYQLNKSFFLLS